VEKSELGQKSKKLASDLSTGIERTAETISKQTEQLSQSNVFQSVAHVSILVRSLLISLTYFISVSWYTWWIHSDCYQNVTCNCHPITLCNKLSFDRM